MKLLFTVCVVIFVLPGGVFAQDDEWPPFSYLRNDYKAVSVVVHVRIDEAEIISRIDGYESWKLNGVVLESFKGRFRKGDAIEFNNGAEAGFKRDYFTGERIVFLLVQRDRARKVYVVLENSTLPHTNYTVRRLRLIRKSSLARRSRAR